ALTGCADNSVRLWDVQTRLDIRPLFGHTKGAYAVAFLPPDGRRALSGSADMSVRLWDVEAGRELHRFDGHNGMVWGVAVSAAGRRALPSSGDHTTRLWRLPSPDQAVTRLPTPVPPPAKPAGGQDLGPVGEIRRLEGHSSDVWSVAFSRD